MKINDFTEMTVWKLAREIVNEIYKVTANLPATEDYALTGQTRRAALSIAANIAEGFGRGHKKEKVHFYLISRGSTHEVRSHLLMGCTIGYFRDEEVQVINVKCQKVRS